MQILEESASFISMFSIMTIVSFSEGNKSYNNGM